MFPGQMLVNPSAQAEVAPHCDNVLVLASSLEPNETFDRHIIVFALFLAGVATTDTNSKIQAMNLIAVVESHGIGQNAKRARELLRIVCEEQRQRLIEGGRAEEVDWITVSQARGLEILNCGL
jgi:hypothetical protein